MPATTPSLNGAHDNLSSSDLDDRATTATDPIPRPGATSPSQQVEEDCTPLASHKKKKKKPKKSAKAKEAAAAAKAQNATDPAGRPSVLCISRNKHWRYISSYHGPWLQLPLELLESLLVLNLDPTPLSAPDNPLLPTTGTVSSSKRRDRGYHILGDSSCSRPESPTFSSHPIQPLPFPPPPPPPFPPSLPGKPTPPPIDPGAFRSVTNIRRLIDEAAELSVRAASGLSAVELGSLRGGSGLNGNPWAAAQSLGINPLGGNGGNGRNVAMSAMRIHRLRALAVQKLAQAYRADEIASSVMVMQGGTVFDDVAERVLKHDPSDMDAKYVHFFHEKIPSRQLSESTTTKVLDELIAAQPQRLEYYRTRGIVHCFRDEYPQATKDFTHALKESRAARKGKALHCNTTKFIGSSQSDYSSTYKSHRRRKSHIKGNGQAPPDGTSPFPGLDSTGTDGPDDLPLHPSALPSAPDPIEPQLLFLRGAAYLQHAMYLIERTVLELEGVPQVVSVDGAELRLCYIENGKYGGVEIGNPDGPLGRRDGEKAKAYRRVLAGEEVGGGGGLRSTVEGLVRKSIRDHERFLAHFDSIDSGAAAVFQRYEGEGEGEVAAKMEYAFLLAEATRPGNHHHRPAHHPFNHPNGFASSSYSNSTSTSAYAPPLSASSSASSSSSYSSTYTTRPNTPTTMTTMTTTTNLPIPATFMTYHPLLVESYFSVLIGQLMLGDFTVLLPSFLRTALLVDSLEGYPIFLPPRSVGQAEFVEVLERLAGGWRHGAGGAGGRGKARLAIEPPPELEQEPEPELKRTESPVGMEEGSLAPLSSASSSSGHVSTSSSRKNSDTLRECCAGGSGSGNMDEMKTPTTNGSASTAGSSFASSSTSGGSTYAKKTAHGARSLECARLLLAPVIKRQRERAEKAAMDKAAAANRKKKGQVQAQAQSASINIPLHGPRVEVILAWLGAVHLPELEEY